jgi:putative oxidoreductase
MSSLSTTKSYGQAILGNIDLRTRLCRFWTLPLRLIVGYGFMAHGFAKLSRGPETFAVVLHTLGIPQPSLLAWLTTLTELIGGFCILVGAFVPIVSLPMAIVLLTALSTIHLPYGFFSVKLAEVSESGTKFGPVGYEIILLYLAGLITLVLGGAGSFSIDEWRRNTSGHAGSRKGSLARDLSNVPAARVEMPKFGLRVERDAE